MDFTLGIDAGRSTKAYTDTRGVAAGVTLAWRRAPEAEVTRVVAATVGGRFGPASSDVCDLVEPGNIDAGCKPDFPGFAHLGVLGGIEQVTSGASGRVLIGPAVFLGQGSSGLGGRAQLDAAFPGRSHVGFVASLHGSAIRRFSGETLGLLGLSFGIRFQ